MGVFDALRQSASAADIRRSPRRSPPGVQSMPSLSETNATPSEWNSSSDPTYLQSLSAQQDLPLYLDLMLLYLRIEADAFAVVVSYFYERDGIVPTRSFREQRKWFLEKRPEFDPEYARILGERCTWFDSLAGKQPAGLRDVIVHKGGTYQLGWTLPTLEDEFDLRASVLDARGFVEDDLFKALVEVTQGWFAFLDQCCSHFRAKLQPVVTWADISSDELSRYLHCGGTQLPSFWVYPQTV